MPSDKQRQSRARNTHKRAARRKSSPSRTTRPHAARGGSWSPATSLPGELYTPTGRIKAAGSFARGLQNLSRHPLRSEMRSALRFFAVAAPCVLAAAWLADRLL